jgi:hypothetical protein
MPPESSVELVTLPLQAHLREGFLGLLLPVCGRDALDLEAEGDVVEDGPVRQQPEMLKDHTDLPAPNRP